MQKIQKSTTLYPHPFSKAYWHDAATELKDTKMLVIAALMIALRVSMKWTVIPLAPNLNINVGAHIDVQVRGQGNDRPLHGNAQGDHQSGDDQHFGVLQLRGGIVPVGLGEGMGIEGGAFLNFLHKNASFLWQRLT